MSLTFTSLVPILTLLTLLTVRASHAVHVHQRDTQARGFHYHYEVISPSGLPSGTVSPPSPSGNEPAIEPLRTDESRATFGYRKPSGEYRVVDYLAEGLGFNRKGMLSDSDRPSRDQRQASSQSTSTTTTTARPSPIYVPSTTTPAADYDDEEEDREPLPIPPPAPLRMGKTSPAQQARLMRQQDQSGMTNGKIEEQRMERIEAKTSSVKGGSRKSKENEIRQEKMDKPEPTTVRSPLPPTTTTTTATTTTTSATPVVERESEALMIRPSTGRIKGRLPEVTPESMTTTTIEPEMSKLEQPQKLVLADREQPQNKISIHQLISQAMPTLQMSVVPVYFMNKATRTVMAVPYLVMKSVSKMPLIPGMVDALSGPSLMGAQNLLSFANQKTERNIALQPIIPNMMTMRPPIMDQQPAVPLVRGADAGQLLESGVEESNDDDASSATGMRSSSPTTPVTQSDSNWVTIDSPVTSESLDNTWFKR